jgi:hypothetical protein
MTLLDPRPLVPVVLAVTAAREVFLACGHRHRHPRAATVTRMRCPDCAIENGDAEGPVRAGSRVTRPWPPPRSFNAWTFAAGMGRGDRE